MAVPQPVSLHIPLEERFRVLLKPELPFGQLLALKRGHTWPGHPVDKIHGNAKNMAAFCKVEC